VQPRPLEGLLVVDLTRYLPGPFATRELLRLGAHVVRLEAPEGDPLRDVASHWDALLNAGKESVVCDLKADPALGRALCARADVVVESFRPGVAARLGVGPDDVPAETVYCSLRGYGGGDDRAGHDLNYLGWVGALAATAPASPPLPIADLAAALTIVSHVLAALLERARNGRGARIEVALAEVARELAPFGGPLTGELACYRIYETADGRHLTVAALEPRFWERLVELVGRPDLRGRAADGHRELEELFASRPLAEWVELFEGEDVAVAPVRTLDEAGLPEPEGRPPALGEHTEAWRSELGLAAA
jgi:crotonobetainyl-CoA:carnitine CoA-transferase CaiB-like acyl-CoA transferase